MREGRALGEPGGAAGVLDVDGVVELQPALVLEQLVLREADRVAPQVLPLVVEHDGLAQLGAAEPDLAHHGHVVRPPEGARHHQGRHAGLLERVLELVEAVGGVHVHQDRAHPRGRVLHDHPLLPVRRPDADPVALLHAAHHQAARHARGLLPELPPGGAVALLHRHERLAVGEPLRRAPQVLPDGLAEERPGRGAAHVGRVRHRVSSGKGWHGRRPTPGVEARSDARLDPDRGPDRLPGRGPRAVLAIRAAARASRSSRAPRGRGAPRPPPRAARSRRSPPSRGPSAPRRTAPRRRRGAPRSARRR